MNILIEKPIPGSSYLFLPFCYLCLYSYLCCLIILIVFKFIFVRPRSGRSRHQLLAAAQVPSQVCPLHLLCNAASNIICDCICINICVLSKAESRLCIPKILYLIRAGTWDATGRNKGGVTLAASIRIRTFADICISPFTARSW